MLKKNFKLGLIQLAAGKSHVAPAVMICADEIYAQVPTSKRTCRMLETRFWKPRKLERR